MVYAEWSPANVEEGEVRKRGESYKCVCVCVCVCGRKQRQNVQLVVVTVRHEWQFRCDHKCVAETVRLVAISSKFY